MTGTNSTTKFAILLPILGFKNALIKFIRLSENKIFNIDEEVGIKLLTTL